MSGDRRERIGEWPCTDHAEIADSFLSQLSPGHVGLVPLLYREMQLYPLFVVDILKVALFEPNNPGFNFNFFCVCVGGGGVTKIPSLLTTRYTFSITLPNINFVI